MDAKAASTEAVVEIPRLYLFTALGGYRVLLLEHIDQLSLFDYNCPV